MRKSLVAGNWKMNGNKLQNADLLQQLINALADLGDRIDCVVCPPFVYLDQVFKIVELTNIQLGAQDLASSAVAAFTGEISPSMLGEFGCNYVILGHSERRTLLAEPDALVADKFKLALEGGLKPILCVGETREQMEAARGFEVVARQIQAVLNVVGISGFAQAVIAYEPVWAIGTGLTATPEQAQAMHQRIRMMLSALDVEIAEQIRIVYGGSVNSSNAQALFSCADIDGGLIGGASLKAQDFSDICHIAERVTQ